MTVEEILIDNGYEGIMTFTGPDYDDALITARKDFNEQVGDDEYYVKYVLTDKGLDLLEGLKNE